MKMDQNLKTAIISAIIIGVFTLLAACVTPVVMRIIDNWGQNGDGGGRPAPTAVSNPPLIFADDFDFGISSDWQVIAGEWQAENGRLVPTDFSREDGDAGLLLASLKYKGEAGAAYRVAFDAGDLEEEHMIAAWVSVQDVENAMIFAADSEMAYCGRYVDGEHTQLQTVTLALGRDAHHYVVEVRGDAYAYWIDDQRVCAFSDTTFTGGQIGLWDWRRDSSAASVLWFDDVEVTSLR